MCESRFVAVRGSWIVGDGPLGFICIYAPNKPLERQSFFHNLISFVHNWECSDFIVFSNFNSILYDEERWGVNGFGEASEELWDFVDTLLLHDFPLLGSSFTFFGSENNMVHKRG